MAFDKDIEAMNNTQLQTQLRALKVCSRCSHGNWTIAAADDVPSQARGMKVKVSGTNYELKTRLQQARTDLAASTQPLNPNFLDPNLAKETASSAVPSPAASGSISASAAPVTGLGVADDEVYIKSDLTDILFNYSNLHQTTLNCVHNLNRTLPRNPTDDSEMIDSSSATQAVDEDQALSVLLQPVAQLINEVIAVKQDMATSLSSSGAVNLELLARSLRHRLPLTVVPHAAAALFKSFDLAIEVGVPEDPNGTSFTAEASDITTTAQASISTLDGTMDSTPDYGPSASLYTAFDNTFDGDIEVRHQQEILESLRINQHDAADPASPPTHLGLDGVMDMSAAEQSAAVPRLRHEVDVIQEALFLYIRDWMTELPPPAVRQWPNDFSRDEIVEVKTHLKKWMRDPVNGVNLDLPYQPDTKAEEAAKAMMADDKFPVADAKKTEWMQRLFRGEASLIYTGSLRNKAGQARAGIDDPDRIRSQAGWGRKRGKHAKDVPMPVGNVDDDDGNYGDDDYAEQEGSSSKGKKRSRTDKEAMGVSGPAPSKKQKQQKQQQKQQQNQQQKQQQKQTSSQDYGHSGTECMACFFAGVPCELSRRNDPDRLCGNCFIERMPCRVLCGTCAATANSAGRGRGASDDFLWSECTECDWRQEG